MSAAETYTFETEAKQILELMTHSVYSNREIFLRELISNSSDALDKLRFESIEDKSLLGDEELGIWLEVDAEKRTLTISDNGIGMSRDEVIKNIGTIARSGTKEFASLIAKSKEAASSPDLIGQFGVGFYSVFMVADQVELETRRAGEDQSTHWLSTGDGNYVVKDGTREKTGTTITLHLKEADTDDGMQDFVSEWVLRDIIKRYSDFVAYPIQMDVTRQEPELDDEGKPVEGGTPKEVVETETLNSMKAIWTRARKDVSDEEYHEFYKHISHDWQEPLDIVTLKAEGTYQYQAVLFIPGKAPFNLFHADHKVGVKLYVRRVFIMDECKELLPEYLRFVKGVVDAEDLSLNISREILQQDRHVQMIRKRLVKKVLDSLKDMKANKFDDYKKFWAEFGAVLKEGLYGDPDHRDELLGLMLCDSTNDQDEQTSLADYVERMPADQEAMYYMTGSSRQAVENSPHLEGFAEKNYEVMIFTDPVDEIWLQREPEFEEKKFVSVGKGAVELGSEEDKAKAKEDLKAQEETYKTLLERLQAILDEEVKEVRLSSRMTTSAACLVVDKEDMSPQMEQLLSQMGQGVPAAKRILEINPKHPVLEKLQGIFGSDSHDPLITDYANLLHGQALLAEGGQLKDPGTFSRLVTDLMVKSL